MEAVNVEEDKELIKSELLSIKEELVKQTDSKSDRDFSKTENVMSSERQSEILLNNKTGQDPDDTSNLNLQTSVEDAVSSKEYEQTQDNMTDINIEKEIDNNVERQEDENNTPDFITGSDMSYDVTEIQQQHEKDMEELRVTLQDEYQKQVLKISDELRDHYQTDLDEKITKLEEDWELEFTKQKKEFDEQVSVVQREQWAQCEEAIERVTLDAEDQLKKMKYAYERETAEHKQRIKELLEREALWEMKENELANEKCEKENESLNKIKKLENQLLFEREEVESQLNDAKDEIKTLKRQHKSEMESLSTELEKKYSDIVDEMRQELKSKYQNEMDRKVNQVESHLREQYEQDLEKTKEEVQESTSTLKMKYDKQISETLTQLEELHERNQQHELREGKLKQSFESERRKVVELKKEMEAKTLVIQELEENGVKIRNEFQELEKKLKQSLNEKFALEKRVQEILQSGSKELTEVRADFGRKSEHVHELEGDKSDSKTKKELEELREKLQCIAKQKDILEQKLNENIKSEKLNAEVLCNELDLKDEEVERIQEKEADEKNCKEYKELEEKVRSSLQEKLLMEQTLEQIAESKNKQIEDLQQELERKHKEMQELRDKINDGKKNDEYLKLESKLNEMTLEKQGLQQQLEEYVSEISLLKEKLNENENVNSDLKSKYEKKILQVTRSYEEEINALENELKLKEECENEAAKLKKDVCTLEEEIFELNEELQKHKSPMSELEETSRARELEIANLILNPPSPQTVTDLEFDFSEESSDRTQQLEVELAKYKKKVQELEEEAEDKFETTLCPNCNDREQGQDILLQTNTWVDEIQHDCQKKVQDITRDLEKMEESLHEKIKESDALKQKLTKTEQELRNERKRTLEFLKLRRNLDVNGNALEYDETSKDIQGTSEGNSEGYGSVMSDNIQQMLALNSLQSHMKDEDDKVQKEDNQSQMALANSEDLKSLFEKQEKFYKTEILRKDNEISKLMDEKEQEVETLKEKIDKGEAQYMELRGRSLEQKTKYENEINLMQSEIKMVIQENNEGKDQLEIFQKKSENLQTKLQETEKELKEMSGKYELEIVTLKESLQEKGNCILDLQNALQESENCKNEMKLNLLNQEQDFSERERKLLVEIRKKTATFDSEKTEIFNESFLDKEEKKEIINLEMLLPEQDTQDQESKQWKFEGYGGIEWDNLPITRGACDKQGDVNGYGEVDWSRNGFHEAANVSVQYEEINYAAAENMEHREIREPLSMGTRYHALSNNDSLFSDGNYEEIGCNDVDEEDFELLKLEHDIDLALERKENERLRSEIDTLSRCVDVFHNECEALKRSLDNTVDLVSRLRDERDNLMKEHDLNMTEHSELMLDLIKYEETINKLERGNEKLENDRKLLEECLQEKPNMLSNLKTDVKYSVQQDSNVHELKDFQLQGQESDYRRNDTEYLRKSKDVSKRTEGQMSENIVKEVEFRSRSFPDVEVEHEVINRTFSSELDDEEQPLSEDVAVLWPTVNGIYDQNYQAREDGAGKYAAQGILFKVSKDENSHGENSYVRTRSALNHSKRNIGEYNFQSQPINTEESYPFLKYGSEIQVSPKVCRSEFTQERLYREMTPLPKKVTSKQQLKKGKGKTLAAHTSGQCDEKDSSNRRQNKDNVKHTSTSKGGSIFPRPSEVSFDSRKSTIPSSRFHNHTGRNGYGTTKSLKLSSENFIPKMKELSGTPVSNTSTKSINSSKFSSSSILTSTRANLTTTDRLLPNLSGVSPIISPLDRHYHAQKQKWKTSDQERGNIPRGYYDSTTFLMNVDPNGFVQTPGTPVMDGSHKKTFSPHNRSRSADDRLLTSSKNISSDLEIPLIINFEDFVFRHRVRSSENVANLRDPSPAELWFS